MKWGEADGKYVGLADLLIPVGDAGRRNVGKHTWTL